MKYLWLLEHVPTYYLSLSIIYICITFISTIKFARWCNILPNNRFILNMYVQAMRICIQNIVKTMNMESIFVARTIEDVLMHSYIVMQILNNLVCGNKDTFLLNFYGVVHLHCMYCHRDIKLFCRYPANLLVI